MSLLCWQRGWIPPIAAPVIEFDDPYVELTELATMLILGGPLKADVLRTLVEREPVDALRNSKGGADWLKSKIDIVRHLKMPPGIFDEPSRGVFDREFRSAESSLAFQDLSGPNAWYRATRLLMRRVEPVYAYISRAILAGKLELLGSDNGQVHSVIEPRSFLRPTVHSILENQVGPLPDEPFSVPVRVLRDSYWGNCPTTFDHIYVPSEQARALASASGINVQNSERIGRKPGPKNMEAAVQNAAVAAFPPHGRRPEGVRCDVYDSKILECLRHSFGAHPPHRRTIQTHTSRLR